MQNKDSNNYVFAPDGAQIGKLGSVTLNFDTWELLSSLYIFIH